MSKNKVTAKSSQLRLPKSVIQGSTLTEEQRRNIFYSLVSIRQTTSVEGKEILPDMNSLELRHAVRTGMHKSKREKAAEYAEIGVDAVRIGNYELAAYCSMEALGTLINCYGFLSEIDVQRIVKRIEQSNRGSKSVEARLTKKDKDFNKAARAFGNLITKNPVKDPTLLAIAAEADLSEGRLKKFGKKRIIARWQALLVD